MAKKNNEEIFCVKLTRVGNYQCSGDYKIDWDNNAMKLIARNVNCMIRDIGSKEMEPQMRFDLAVLLLKSVDFKDSFLKECLAKDFDEICKMYKGVKR